MGARYSVIQYVPDPATDERINFGVLAFGDLGEVHARFVRNWRRVESFGGLNARFLRDFAREVQQASSGQATLPVGGVASFDYEALLGAVETWKNSIQFTTPRGSTLSSIALVDEVAKRFLKERTEARKRGRDRRIAARAVVQSLEAGLRAHGSRKPEKYVVRNQPVEGEFDEHSFDVALANGEVQLGVLAMSFEGQSLSDLDREISANAWTIDDVRRTSENFPIAVVALPPLSRSKRYDHAVELFESLSADVVLESDVDEWGSAVTAELYEHLIR